MNFNNDFMRNARLLIIICISCLYYFMYIYIFIPLNKLIVIAFQSFILLMILIYSYLYSLYLHTVDLRSVWISTNPEMCWIERNHCCLYRFRFNDPIIHIYSICACLVWILYTLWWSISLVQVVSARQKSVFRASMTKTNFGIVVSQNNNILKHTTEHTYIKYTSAAWEVPYIYNYFMMIWKTHWFINKHRLANCARTRMDINVIIIIIIMYGIAVWIYVLFVSIRNRLYICL